MKKLLVVFVMVVTFSSLIGCTDGILTEEENAQIENQEIVTGTDPTDDGTVDPDPQETGNEGG